jgi:hypothetical protein
VEAYLAQNPDDVGAMVLHVRVARVTNMLRPTVIGSREGGGLQMDTVDHYAPLQATLDRAIELAPGMAEPYYWKARLHALQRVRWEHDEPVIRADWDLAVEPAGRAVALAPEEDHYRVALGMSLAQTGDVPGAMEVLQDAEKGKNVLYQILRDFERVPVPESALPFQRMADAGAEMFAGAQ